jgi:hypothetical protein
MSATRPRLGVAHPTVVPTNHRARTDDPEEADAETNADTDA